MIHALRYRGITAVTDAAGATGVIRDDYDDAVGVTSYALGYNQNRYAQSWDAGASVSALTGSSVKLIRTGKPVGYVVLNIKAHTGTFGSSSLPTGLPVVWSIPLRADSIATSATYYFGAMSGWTPTGNTKYVLEVDGRFLEGDINNHISVRVDATAAGHEGNGALDTSGISYSAQATEDMLFKVYSVSGSGGGAVDTGDMTYKRARMARSAR